MKKNIKGIVLAGGAGTRLHPITKSTSKQLLPIYDKPMIYYPISVLMLAGIKDILIISTPHDIESYKRLLGNGSQFGLNLEYCIQEEPAGLAQAFTLGESFIGDSNVALVLGDNIFYGEGFSKKLAEVASRESGATLFGIYVNDPERFGGLEFSDRGDVLSLEEKPKEPKSNYAVTGLYFYDNTVIEIAKSIKPSERGELEITDVNNAYLKKNDLRVEILGRGFTWLDTGTFDSLIEAGQFIKTIEQGQGLKVGCLEQIAYDKNWISFSDIQKAGLSMEKNAYGKYLLSIKKR